MVRRVLLPQAPQRAARHRRRLLRRLRRRRRRQRLRPDARRRRRLPRRLPADRAAQEGARIRRARTRLPSLPARPLRRVQPRLRPRHAVRASVRRTHREHPDVDAAGGEVALRLAPRGRHVRGRALPRLPASARVGRRSRRGAGGRRRLGAPMKRIGLFGGSFDPVHLAHVALARLALAQLGLDEVRWIPAGRPWQKARALTSAADREAMVRLAIADEPGFVLDRTELRRTGVSYTLDTVRELDAAEPGTRWVLILGQDQYATLHTWRDWRELLALVTLAIARRPDADAAVNAQIARFPHQFVDLPMMAISSTEIRRRVAAGESIAGLVPEAVARYIERRGLYRVH